MMIKTAYLRTDSFVESYFHIGRICTYTAIQNNNLLATDLFVRWSRSPTTYGKGAMAKVRKAKREVAQW